MIGPEKNLLHGLHREVGHPAQPEEHGHEDGELERGKLSGMRLVFLCFSDLFPNLNEDGGHVLERVDVLLLHELCHLVAQLG